MPGELQALVWAALGIVALFAVVMILGLRYASRSQARSLECETAIRVWRELGRSDSPDPGLLYGTWQRSMHGVVLTVKDADDQVVGEVTQRGLGGLDTSIAIGSATFRVKPQVHWREAADLVAVEPTSGPTRVLCSFTVGAHRLATYTCEDGRKLAIPSGRAWPWRRRVLNIECMGGAIGSLWTPGSPWFNQGRALLLPVEIALAVRLFVLWKGTGLNTRPVTR